MTETDSCTLAAVFFLSQFATALLWGAVSQRIGRRNVLFVSLFGNTIMLLLYGTCQSVPAMIAVRVCQGALNGSIGVARTAVKEISDSTNEGRAYSIMGLTWSLGGIIGPILGGWLEHPVENIPRWFGGSSLLHTYPYLLPTAAAASVTFTGAVLCLFLSYNGGPREGGIRLPEEKDVERVVSKVASLPSAVSKRVSGYFNEPDSGVVTPSEALSPAANERTDPLHHRVSRTSFAIPAYGSAYGYSRRDTGISRFRKMSVATTSRYAPDFEGGDAEAPSLNFAQRSEL